MSSEVSSHLSLYGRWLAVVDKYGDEVAVWAGEDSFSFRDLAAAVEDEDVGRREVRPVAGHGMKFIVDVLCGWRDGAVVWPQDSVARNDAGGVAVEDLPDEVVHLKSTSGSTGAAKVVMFDAAALAADAEQIVLGMGMCEDRVNIAAISLAHSYGFSNLVLPLLLHGIPMRFAESPLPGAVREALSLVGGKCTFAAVPAMWLAWFRAGIVAEFADTIVTAISAGAPLPLELEREVFDQCGVKVHNFYGSSECGGIAYDGSSSPREDAAFVGDALANVALRLGEEGCLEVRGRTVALGYFQRPDDEALGDGVFRTSDLAQMDGSKISLVGRVDDMINVAGRKIAPAKIEAVLKESPLVREALVFGVDCADQAREQRIVAVVALDCGDESVLDDLKRRCGERLETWQAPKDWWMTPELMPDGRGKISRAKWREKWERRLEVGDRG